MTARRFSCPEDMLAGEINLALVFTMACNPGRAVFAAGDLALFSVAIAKMLAERAESGLSGMSLEDDTGARSRNLGKPGVTW